MCKALFTWVYYNHICPCVILERGGFVLAIAAFQLTWKVLYARGWMKHLCIPMRAKTQPLHGCTLWYTCVNKA